MNGLVGIFIFQYGYFQTYNFICLRPFCSGSELHLCPLVEFVAEADVWILSLLTMLLGVIHSWLDVHINDKIVKIINDYSYPAIPL